MMRGLLVGAGALGLAGSVAWSLALLPPASTPRVPSAPVEPEPAASSPAEGFEATAAAAALPPGARVPRRVGRVSSGIRCPDGSHLPLLNGVPAAPPITRSPHLGPVPPVVAILVDQEGNRWYEHADGSATTTRFRVDIVDGVARSNVETVHNARLPDSRGLPREPRVRSAQ